MGVFVFDFREGVMAGLGDEDVRMRASWADGELEGGVKTCEPATLRVGDFFVSCLASLAIFRSIALLSATSRP